jgi:hypothetical protein
MHWNCWTERPNINYVATLQTAKHFSLILNKSILNKSTLEAGGSARESDVPLERFLIGLKSWSKRKMTP